MPMFRLAASITVSAYTTVEAETEDDAIRIAETRPVEFSSGPYSRQEHWLIEEADGSPQNIVPDED